MPFSFARTRVLIAASLLAVASALTGCGGNGGVDETRIAAAFYPLAYAAERVAGDHYDVVNLTQPGVEPHDLELNVQQTADISRAALVVLEKGFQPAVDATVEQNAEGEVLDAADVIELRPVASHEGEGHHAEEEDDEHDHGDLDPHFWQDPLLMADLGEAIADQLADLDPDHAADYASNAARLRADLEALDAEYADTLDDCDRDLVVVNHDAFGYLSRYGLHVEPIAGISPDAEASAADRARIEALVRDEGLTTVFSETLDEKKTAESIASDLGVKTAVLDPLEGLTEDAGEADYLSVMRSNLTAISRANGC